MAIATIDWDAIELLPRFRCCVCTANAVPWGRTLDDLYFCSKGCSDVESHVADAISAAPAALVGPVAAVASAAAHAAVASASTSASFMRGSSCGFRRGRGARAGYRRSFETAARRLRYSSLSLAGQTADVLFTGRAA